MMEGSTTGTSDENVAEVYWMPGCSSCLRMKEFVEGSGRPYVEINIAADAAGRSKLEHHGIFPPAVCVGDACVNGVDLSAVARLMGFHYEPPEMLAPASLVDRYRVVNVALRRYVEQIPPDAMGYESPDRARPLLHLVNHAASVIRSFLSAYDDDVHDTVFYGKPPATVGNGPDVVARAAESLGMLDEWWQEGGQDDPLDRVVSTYWGHRTLHEILEREVWHTAQHTRQTMLFLERLGVAPDRPLTPDDLAGLPLPERVHA
jgi:hypothetical protein